jgi:hypothetical protein
MKTSEITRVDGKAGAYKLIYSHDGGFTRYVVAIMGNEYFCLINESACFKRGTHEKMVKLFGANLNDMECATFLEASLYLI